MRNHSRDDSSSDCLENCSSGRRLDNNEILAALLLDDGCESQYLSVITPSTRRVPHLQSMHSSCLQALHGGTVAACTPLRPATNARIEELLMFA